MTFLSSILELLFPHRIHLEECPLAHAVPDQKYLARFNYHSASVKKLIFFIKKYRNEKLFSDIGKELYDELLEEISEQQACGFFENIIIIPAANTASSRNFNQAYLLAKALQTQLPESIVEHILISKKKAQQISLKSYQERYQNMEGSLSYSYEPSMIQGADIIMIDDVSTSAATFFYMEHQLLQTGARKIIGISVAKPILV